MLEWLQDNAFLLTAIINLAMLGVWTFYAALFYRQYAEQRRQKLLIHLTSELVHSAEFLIINLGYAALHIEAVLAVGESSDTEKTTLLSDYSIGGEASAMTTQESSTYQGPLGPAAFFSAGRAIELLHDAHLPLETEEGRNAEEHMTLEIRVIAIGQAERLVAARRRFIIDAVRYDRPIIYPDGITQQLASRKQQRQAREWLSTAAEAALPPRRENQERSSDRPAA